MIKIVLNNEFPTLCRDSIRGLSLLDIFASEEIRSEIRPVLVENVQNVFAFSEL